MNALTIRQPWAGSLGFGIPPTDVTDAVTAQIGTAQ